MHAGETMHNPIQRYIVVDFTTLIAYISQDSIL